MIFKGRISFSYSALFETLILQVSLYNILIGLPTITQSSKDGKKKGSTVNKIDQIKRKREERRAKMDNMVTIYPYKLPFFTN